MDAVFAELGCAVEWHHAEGVAVAPGPGEKIKVATVTGKARHLLMGERTALNVLCRAAGIATKVSLVCYTKYYFSLGCSIQATTPIAFRNIVCLYSSPLHQFTTSPFRLDLGTAVRRHASLGGRW